jgi:transposase-like protein
MTRQTAAQLPRCLDLPPGTGVLADIEASFANDPRCPQCASDLIAKWGSANRLKRYRCKACKATFNALTGTPLAQLHKRELWCAHAQALIDGIALRKVGTRLGIHLDTAFRWRHRSKQRGGFKIWHGLVSRDTLAVP